MPSSWAQIKSGAAVQVAPPQVNRLVGMSAARCHLSRMLQLVRYGLPAFASGLRRTGKVYDKCMTSLHANSAREHGAARLGHRVRTDRLGNTRHLAIADGTRRLGRHIAHRKPRAAAGEHDIGVALIGGFHNSITDLADVVAHDHMLDDRPALRLDKFLECGSSLVLG